MHNHDEENLGATTLPELLSSALIRARVIPISKRTFFRYVASGVFPEADARVAGKPFWTRGLVLGWLENQKAGVAR